MALTSELVKTSFLRSTLSIAIVTEAELAGARTEFRFIGLLQAQWDRNSYKRSFTFTVKQMVPLFEWGFTFAGFNSA